MTTSHASRRGPVSRILQHSRAIRIAAAARWIRETVRAIAAALQRISGAPDYDAYVAHLRRTQPDATPLDRNAFEEERLARRYSEPGPRCC